MGNYAYPAIFDPEETGFSIYFPDIKGCFTCGENLADAFLMAEDALAVMLASYKTDGIAIPPASPAESIALEPGQAIHIIACNTDRYERKFARQAVRKSVSIPKWLNDEAVAKGVNFSEVLRNGLLSLLGHTK